MKLLTLPTHLSLVLALFLSCSSSHAQRNLTTIAIHNSEPDFLIRALEPQLSEGSSIRHYQNQLIINATPAELARIMPLISQLDGSGKQLVFSLRRKGGLKANGQVLKVEGSPRITNTGHGGLRVETRSNVTVRHRSMTGSSQSGQGIRATEGSAAYIAIGSSAPIKIYNSASHSSAYQQQAQTISSGFYATAWVDADTVSVNIDQRDNRYQQGTVSTQQLQSRVSGRLGTWMAIGVITENQNMQQAELTRLSAGSTDNSSMLYLKVELLP